MFPSSVWIVQAPMIAGMILFNIISFTHTHHLAQHILARQATWIMSFTAGWLCVYRVDVCVSVRRATSGECDWPGGTAARRNDDWMDVWRIACSFPCSFASQSGGRQLRVLDALQIRPTATVCTRMCESLCI